MKSAARWVVVVICLWAFPVFSAEPLVLRIFHDFQTAAELGLSPNATECRELEPLTKGVIGPLFADFCQKNGVVAGQADLKEYCRKQLDAEALFKEAWAEWAPNGSQWRARQAAVVELTMWKLQKALFEKYGGRVIQNTGNQPQAFDAMVAYVAEREKAKDFTILDARLKLRFWECLRRPKMGLVSEETGRPLIEEHPVDRRKRKRSKAP